MKRSNFFLPALFALALAHQVSAYNIPPFATDTEVLQAINGNNNNNPPNNKTCSTGSPLDVSTGDYIQSLPILSIAGRGPELSIGLTYHSFKSHAGPFGIGWSMGYDQRVLKLTDGVVVVALCGAPNGRQDRYVRNADGSYATPAPLQNKLTENGDGTWVLREKTGAIRNFDANGRMSAIVDRNGNALTFQYDNTGFLTTMTDASGRNVTFTKGASGRVATITDPANRQFQFTYNASGAMTGITDPLGNASAMTYTTDNRLAFMGDPKGNILARATYNADGTLATYVDRGETWTIAYSPSTNTTTETDSSANRWTHVYNATGSITRTTDPLGNSINRTYDANGNITQSTDQNGNSTIMTYDANGNALTVKDALNNTVTTTYDSIFNFPLSTTDRLGNVTTFAYDAKGNRTKVTDPLGNSAQYQYDASGQVVKVIDALGNSSTITYDTYGNVLTRTNALNQTSSATYDILGNITAVTDANGKTTQSTFDANRRRTKTVDPIGGMTIFQYDASGNLLSITLPNGGVIAYQYDTLNRMQKATNPIGNTSTFAYDKKDNLISRLDPNGVTTTYVYDALSRVTARNGGSDPLVYTYDKVGNILTLRNTSTTLTYVYDALNRVTQAKTSASSFQPTTTITLAYNANGQRTTMTDPSGGATNYGYDAALRLTSIQDPASQTFGFSYDAVSRRTGMTGPLGHAVTYGYDAAGRLSALNDQASAGNLASSYTRDAVGNILSKADNLGNHVYGYDSLFRLTSAMHPAGQTTEAYAYDSMGNRTSSHLSATYVNDSANRMTADATFDYLYDNNGNLTKKTERSTGLSTVYSYDSENRLTSVQAPSGSIYSYKYDGQNRRIAKLTAGIAVVEYIYDQMEILAEYSGTGVLAASYTQGAGVDEILSVRRGAVATTFQKDHLGSIVQTISSGGVSSTTQRDSYGQITTQTGSAQSPYSFTGRELDSETGLFYYRARYYDPVAGRFLTRDPSGFAGGDANFYRYAFNNPTNFVDPLGLDAWTRFWGGVRAVGGGFEAAAGVGLGVSTSWTGIGAVAGGAVALHGVDQVQAGLRQLFGDCPVDSFTSQGLQGAGLSRGWANGVDAGISVVGTFGATAVGQYDSLFARSTGLLNDNPYLRIGEGWSGPANSEVFRISVGGKNLPIWIHFDLWKL